MPAPVSRHQCKRPFKHTEETCEHIRMEEQVEHIRKELLAAQKVIESFDNQLISGETKEEISDENKSTEEKDADENVQKLCSQLAKSSLTEETRKHDVEERLTEMINYFKVVGFPKLINEKISINIDEATRSVHKLREFYPELTETIFIKFMKFLTESLSCQQFYDKILDDDETSKCYDATLKFFEKVMSTEWSEEDLNSFKKKNFEKYGLNVVGAAYLVQMSYPMAEIAKLIQWYPIVLIMDNKIAFRSCGGTVSHAIRMMNSHLNSLPSMKGFKFAITRKLTEGMSKEDFFGFFRRIHTIDIFNVDIVENCFGRYPFVKFPIEEYKGKRKITDIVPMLIALYNIQQPDQI